MHIVLFLLFLVFYSGVEASTYAENLQNEMPDAFVLLPKSRSINYIILVEKSSQKLFLYSYDGSYKMVFNMSCSTGKVSGAKRRSGDKKTPEGVYFFLEEYKKERLTPIYGTRAFSVDYPNVFDRLNDLGGNAIWMHGSNSPIKSMNSNGCIVLNNNNIDRLAKYITLKKSVLKKYLSIRIY